MTDAELYRLIDGAFVDAPRPIHFTDPTHCPECADHDKVLCSKTVETLTIEDVGNPGWDPICFISPEGYRYYFPALVRLALTRKEDYYLSQFLFHFAFLDHTSCFNQPQKEGVLTVLHHILEHHTDKIEGNWGAEDLLARIGQWEEFVR